MPDTVPVLTPSVLEIGMKLRKGKDEQERLIGELERIERHALEAARQARIILDNNGQNRL